MPEDYRAKLDAAAYRDITEKLSLQVNDKNASIRKKIGDKEDDQEKEEFPQPDRPIYNLSDADMGYY